MSAGKRSCPCCHWGYVGGPHDKGCCVPELERLRATVAELRERVRLLDVVARLAHRGIAELIVCGCTSDADMASVMGPLTDALRPLPKRATRKRAR